MIDVDRRGGIAVLTLAHGKANVFDLELCDALAARFEELDASSCGAVVVTGRGSIFSAGVDLLRIVNDGADYVMRFLSALNRVYDVAFHFSKPVVAAVNGHAIAGGAMLAFTADRRLMARGGGRIGIPELIVGVPFPAALLEIARFAVAPRYASELIYEGVTLDADRAVEYGLVDRAVDAGALLDEAMSTAEALASRPPDAFAMTKRQLREPTAARMRAGRELFDADVNALWCAPATHDAIRGYIERTFKRSGR